MVPLAHPFFFFNDTATTEIYTLSLHDALPISQVPACEPRPEPRPHGARVRRHLLLAPLRPRDAARGDDGRARDRRPPRQGALRGDLLVLSGEDARGGRDPARPRDAAPDPPAVVLDAEPVDRAGAPRRARRGGRRLYLLLAPRAGHADRPLPRGHPRGLAGEPPELALARPAHRRGARQDPRAERDRAAAGTDPPAHSAPAAPLPTPPH